VKWRAKSAPFLAPPEIAEKSGTELLNQINHLRRDDNFVTGLVAGLPCAAPPVEFPARTACGCGLG
jgi:hypothetical protein